LPRSIWPSICGREPLTTQAQELRVEASRLAAHLDASREEAARWRREVSDPIAGLSAEFDLQCERWQLTTAEKAVARLLLEGLSHKEVAGLRAVSETTVRQQARAIYRKAGLSGRNRTEAGRAMHALIYEIRALECRLIGPGHPVVFQRSVYDRVTVELMRSVPLMEFPSVFQRQTAPTVPGFETPLPIESEPVGDLTLATNFRGYSSPDGTWASCSTGATMRSCC
jgi:DNA-binding CsgD family transcriptional regulator